MKDIIMIIILAVLGLFMLYKIFTLIRKDFIGVEGSNPAGRTVSDDDKIIIMDLDEE